MSARWRGQCRHARRTSAIGKESWRQVAGYMIMIARSAVPSLPARRRVTAQYSARNGVNLLCGCDGDDDRCGRRDCFPGSHG